MERYSRRDMEKTDEFCAKKEEKRNKNTGYCIAENTIRHPRFHLFSTWMHTHPFASHYVNIMYHFATCFTSS